MGNKARLGWLLAIGIGTSVFATAQIHGGGHGGSAGMSPAHMSHGFGSGGHSGFGFNSTPNTVSSQVGVGVGHNYYGTNGFHNPHPPGFGAGPYRDGDGDRHRDGDYRRGGIAVGVIPFFPYGYGGYGPYDGYYNDGEVPYDSSVDANQAGPYNQQGPYYDQRGPYDQPGPYVGQSGYQQAPMTSAPAMPAPPPAVAYQAPQQPAADAQAPVPPMPPVTIVLRSGQEMKIQNFAVANGFFWDFSKVSPRKIPIANIDLAASAKATEASGGEFPDLSGNSNAGTSTN